MATILNRQRLAGASGSTAAYTIGQSIRFNDDDSAYMSRTPSVAGNRKTWTWSGWVKRGNILSSSTVLFGSDDGTATNRVQLSFESGDDLSLYMAQSGATTAQYNTSRKFRDPSAWYHIVVAVDTTQATAGNRIRIYVNGSEETSFATETNPDLNGDYDVNTTDIHYMGRRNYNTDRYWDGYLADVHFIDGAALTASSFGETDANGVWVPIEYNAVDTYTALSISNTDNSVDTSDSTAYTFSSQSLGTADADRHIIITTSNSASGTKNVSTLTVGGVSATFVARATTGVEQTAEIWVAAVPTGTTGDVVVTHAGACTRCGIGVFRMIGDYSIYATGTDTSGGTLTSTITVPQDGVAVGVANSDNNDTFTWTNLTEAYDEEVEGGTHHTGASGSSASYASTAISCALSGGGGGTECMAVASFGPPARKWGLNGFHIDGADSSVLGIDDSTTNTAATVTHTYGLLHRLNASSYTFSSVSIGTADATRQIAVGVAGWGATASTFSVSSVTVGGISATAVAGTKVTVGSLNESGTEFWVAPVPTGTSADVVVTFGATMDGHGIELFNVTNGGAAFNGNAVSGDGTNSPTDCTAGGVICGVAWSDGGGTPSYTWTGLTEDHDAQQDAAPTGHSITGASDAFSTYQSALAIDADNSVAPTYMATSTVAFAAGGDNSYLSSGLSASDSMLDSPTDDAANDVGNYCTLSPIDADTAGTALSNGNLDAIVTADGAVRGTFWMDASDTDGWYFEVTVTGTVNGSSAIGIADSTATLTSDGSTGGFYMYYGNGDDRVDTTRAAYGDAYVSTDVIGVLLKNGSLTFYNEDVSQGVSASGLTGYFAPLIGEYNGTGPTMSCNFGQSAFTMTQPTGSKALCTANLPAPLDQYMGTRSSTTNDSQLRASATVARGQAITIDSSVSITGVKFYCKTVGSPTGNVTATIYAATGTVGTDAVGTGSVLATSDTIDISAFPFDVGHQYVRFNFSTPYSASAGDYVISMEYSGGNASNYLHSASDASSPTHDGNACRRNSSGTWFNVSGHDIAFYLEGS